MMNKAKKIFVAIFIILAALVIAGLVDYSRVKSFEKPIFCIATSTADDGGSGHYAGIGYSFDIEGNFLPEDELAGITKYSYEIFGVHVASGIRD